MISTEARNLNRNLATATDASSETSDARRTVASVTARLLRKKSHTGPIPETWPLITSLKLLSVGWLGVRSGVSEKISWDGLNAVEIIQAIGNSVTIATSTAVPLRLKLLSRLTATALLTSALPAARRRGRSRPSR